MGWNDVVELCQKRVEDVPARHIFKDCEITKAFEAYFVARKAYHERMYRTPLMHAWRHTIYESPKEDGSHMKLTEALLDYARRRKFHDGRNPLMKAVKAGRVEIMEFLLRFNHKDFIVPDVSELTCPNTNDLTRININEQDFRGCTALMHCMKYAKKMDKTAAADPIQIQKMKEMTSMLLVEQYHDSKIDIDGPLRNNHGQTAMGIAKSIKYKKLRNVLVDTLMEKL